MKTILRAILLTLAIFSTIAPVNFRAGATTRRASLASAAVQPNIGINGYYSMDRAQRGRTVQAAVVMDIPGGYHVNSNRPLGKYAVPTSVKIEAPGGVRVGGVSYPRAHLRGFSFSEEKIAVFEGRAVMRFTVTVPANYGQGKMELKARVRYQSCSDKECYPPVTRETSLWIDVVNANESTRRANGNIFGGRKQG